ncbi:MAG: DUF3828 domain-containing protein [Methylobacteriaceae bacterium]|nr:DUF3828 domain-containing protein [Methylobacteriaceae bacterium]
MIRALVVFCLLCLAAPAQAQSGDPAAIVREAWRIEMASIESYEKDLPTKLASPWEAAHRRKLFTARIVRLLEADDTDKKREGGVGRLDFDPFLNGQDGTIADPRFAVTRQAGETASVRVTFRNGALKTVIDVAVRREAGAWRIDDIRPAPTKSAPKPESLAEILSAPG